MTAPRISAAALAFIIACEVTDEVTYRQLYQRPTRPGGASGVTVGIGYDLGQVTAPQARADWEAYLPPAWMTRLVQCCGVKGEVAAPMAKALSDIAVSYEAAIAVFKGTSIPRYTRMLLAAVPAAATLPPDCLGALVSLCYNRGASFAVTDDRHREMRAIAAAINEGHPEQVPLRLKDMKRLWVRNPESPPEEWHPLPGLAGLLSRRDNEAALFAHGLATLPQPAAVDPAPEQSQGILASAPAERGGSA